MLGLFLRRERDSNPRYIAVQWFSRPPHSTTLPSLRLRNAKIEIFSNHAPFHSLILRIFNDLFRQYKAI